MHKVEHATAQEVRSLLPRAWSAFFARFGRLTPVQIETIPRIVRGESLVVASATASGKTEAVVAPAAELICRGAAKGLSLLYVVPTRALANDTMARIAEPLEHLGLQTVLKHGDKPTLLVRDPNCLITTPESLDSLLCRRPALFDTLRCIVLDEIHLVDGTYRGDQLRVLLDRLRYRVSPCTFSLHLLSATLAHPAELATRYGSNLSIVSVSGSRALEWVFVQNCNELHTLAKKNNYRKLLCFCNRRQSVEHLTAALTPLWRPYPVMAHHGSLSRLQRESAEQAIKSSSAAVCVSTSTLEIGIDIGDIDLVVLAEPPLDMASLLQRLGRGNRRSNGIRAAALVSSPAERQHMEFLFGLAASGFLEAAVYEPDLSVAVQQLFSLLFARPSGLPAEQLSRHLRPLATETTLDRILAHLGQNSWLEYRGGKWYASSKVMDMGEKGSLHSNIPDDKEREVVEQATGTAVGRVWGIPADTFLLAGRPWRVLRVAPRRIIVARCSDCQSIAQFGNRNGAGAFDGFLPIALRRVRER